MHPIFYGAIAVRFSLSVLANAINLSAPPKFNINADYAIIDRFGFVIYSSRETYIGKNIAIYNQDAFISQAASNLASQRYIMTGATDFPTAVHASFSAGVDSFAYKFQCESVAYPDLNWVLVIGAEYKSFFAELKPLQIIFLIVLIIGGVLVVTTCVIMTMEALLRMARQLYTLPTLSFNQQESIKKNQQCFSFCQYITEKLPLFEIRTLRENIAALRQGLQSFQKYVPEQLVRNIMIGKKPVGLGLETMYITSFFFDVQQFTTISEQTPISILVEALSIFFTETARVIERNHGTIEKFIGDRYCIAFVLFPPIVCLTSISIKALWNLSDWSVDDHEYWGCKAALECIESVHRLCTSEEWKRRKFPELKIRIGVNSGTALVGNVGSPERYNFTAIGEV